MEKKTVLSCVSFLLLATAIFAQWPPDCPTTTHNGLSWRIVWPHSIGCYPGAPNEDPPTHDAQVVITSERDVTVFLCWEWYHSPPPSLAALANMVRPSCPRE